MQKVLILLFISPILLFARINFIPFNVDYAIFNSGDSTAYVEIYISLFQRNLAYKLNENKEYQASFKNIMSIYKTDSLLNNTSHSYVNTLKDTTQEAIKTRQFNQLIDIFKMDMNYDKYTVKIQIIDQISGKKGEQSFELDINKQDKQFYFSTIELCSDIHKDTTNTIFHKNGLKVVPHPRRSYDLLNPLLYYYVELYGLNLEAEKNGTYTTLYYITNSNGDTLKKSKLKTKDIISDAVVDISGFNTMALHAGNYQLHLVARDNSNDNVVSTYTSFNVYKPNNDKKESDENVYSLSKIDQIYIGMSKDDLEAEFGVAKYIATSGEKRIFSHVKDDEEIKLFLTQFWHSRDKKDKLSIGSTRQIYLERTSLANEKYGKGRAKGKGWKTDRGRVLITYGRPDEIQRNANTTNSQPYDTWIYYSLEGGAHFYFADLNGFGDYQLLHSTYRKELKNPDWRSLIQKTGGQGGSSDLLR
jgi:GWxTD domain-containing protein